MDARSECIHGRQKHPRRKGKTFSGCWTCRRRRLKCDENRPGCTRCSTAELECQGYDVRLVWKGQGNDARTSAQQHRSNRRSRLDPTPALTSAAISRAQVHGIQRNLQVTTRNKKPEQASSGLFSVFTSNVGLHQSVPATEPDTIQTITPRTSGGGDTQSSSRITVQDERAPDRLDVTEWPYDPFVTVCHGTGQQSDSSDDLMEKQSHPRLSSFQHAVTPWPVCDVDYPQHVTTPSNISGESALSPAELHANISSGSFTNYGSTEGSTGGTPKKSSHLELFSAPSDECELIDHWITTLSPSMNPVIQDQRELSLTSLALEGINSDAEKSNGGIAVFHGICAASAFHLSNLRNDTARFTKVGIRHRHLALYHLRHSMRDDEHVRDESVWAAIWTFLFQEGICGQPREWRTHLEGLRSLILANPRAVRSSPIPRAVYQSYLCIAILGNFQLDDEFNKLLAEIPPDLDYIEPVHGITRTLLEIVYKINTMAVLEAPSSSIVTDRIKLQLLLYSPATISVAGLDESSAKLLIHYSHIYYYATVIHFQRQLLKKAPDLLQDLVERAIEHLEAVEAANCQPLGCIWTWPCLVVAIECTERRLQARMHTWIESKKRHGFIGLEIAGALARDIWQRRLSAPDNAGEINWHDMIQGSIYDIIPL